MAFCYQKEAFEVGIISGLFLSIIITFFEDAITSIFERIQKNLR